MSQEKILTVIKYLVIAWLALSIVFGTAYLAMILIVLEMVDQLIELTK